jgi:hypothetical protein
MMFLMLIINLGGLKRSVSVGNRFEMHEMGENDFTRLIWVKVWHMEEQVSISYVCKAAFVLQNVCFIN